MSYMQTQLNTRMYTQSILHSDPGMHVYRANLMQLVLFMKNLIVEIIVIIYTCISDDDLLMHVCQIIVVLQLCSMWTFFSKFNITLRIYKI